MIKQIPFAAAAAILLAFSVAVSQQEAPPIRNFLRVNEQFCTGGQPRVEHRAAEEEAMAKELGLRCFNIPVVFADPKDEIRRVLRDGWTIEVAAEEAKKIGLLESPHLNEFARKYIESHQNK